MKRSFVLLVAAAALLVPLAGGSAWVQAREWKDQSGKFNVEAELVEVVGQDVRLRRPDGKILRLPVAKLSAADQKFLKAQPGGAAAGGPAVANGATGGAVGKAAATPTKLDLTYITPDAFAAVIVHPQRLASSALATKLTASAGPDPFAQAEQQLGVDPRSIIQAVAIIPAPSANPNEMMPGVIVRFDTAVDGKEIATKAAKEFTEKTHAGKKYFASSSPQNPSVFVADAKTVILGEEKLLQAMMTSKGAKSDLTDRLSKADLKNDIVIIAAVEKHRDLIKQLAAAAPVPPGQNPAAAQDAMAMLDKIKSATIALSFSGDTLLSVSLEGNDAASTAEISQQATQMVEAAKAMYPLLTGNLQKGNPSQKKLASIGNDAVKGLSAATKGTTITVAMKSPKDLDQLPELVQPLIAQAMMGGFGGGGPPGGAFPPGGEFPAGGDAPEVDPIPGGLPGTPAEGDAAEPGRDLFPD